MRFCIIPERVFADNRAMGKWNRKTAVVLQAFLFLVTSCFFKTAFSQESLEFKDEAQVFAFLNQKNVEVSEFKANSAVGVACKADVDMTIATVKSCQTKFNYASGFCLEKLSPALHKGMAAIGGITALVGTMTSISDSC